MARFDIIPPVAQTVEPSSMLPIQTQQVKPQPTPAVINNDPYNFFQDNDEDDPNQAQNQQNYAAGQTVIPNSMFD